MSRFDWKGFAPATRDWFERCVGQPTAAQCRAWPRILAGESVVVAAPTGSGKTLAAFLAAIDALGRAGPLPDETRVLYISPLKALSNDIHKNLEAPLQGIADARLENGQVATDIRAMVRTGDTPQSARDRMRRQPPHILVTTPESLFILLGSESGRAMLGTVESVIVDEIHALLGNKRGAHLSLSLARLRGLVGRELQMIGLSATQRPLSAVGDFLTGGRSCALVDQGHQRERDLALLVPGSPLTAVMEGEVWGEVYDILAELAQAHRTTLVFVNTRRLAERVARHLEERLGEGAVAAHHGSMSREHRLEAEQRLKAGELRLLVATASLELGIDIGEVDLVCQIGSPGSINGLLQRVGRSGHGVGRVPKGRLLPTTLEELAECTALLGAIRAGKLDDLSATHAALDVLAQHVVAEVAARDWEAAELLNLLRRAWPYRALSDAQWRQVLQMLSEGYTARRGRRGAYLHWDRVNGVLRGRRGARLVALTNAGVIPDQFDYDVILMPGGLRIGSLNEDFAFESLPGDIFQLGNQSYRIAKVESGRVLVEDARGQPPTVPFWFGEAPGRSDALSDAVSGLRQAVGDCDDADAAVVLLMHEYGLNAAAAQLLAEHLWAGQLALGAMPTQNCIVLERFFDETGDMHLVLHSCFGSRINKAWGLALRKRFCRKFNFELQAAALEDSIVLSLGATHSFPLAEVARYLHPDSVSPILEQALLAAPMFPTHWRWNASIALAIRRHLGDRKTPPAWQRNDAEDLLAVVFPDQIACAENLAGPREIPDHPLVAQTMHDCLHELMDLEGLKSVLAGIHQGLIKVVATDVTAPTTLSGAILNARPFAFLDDGDAETRRTLAVARVETPLDDARSLRQLSREAIAEVRRQAWPAPRDADELHDALLIHHALTAQECRPWQVWAESLISQQRAVWLNRDERRLLVASERLPRLRAIYGEAVPDSPGQDDGSDVATAVRELLRGRLEALGPTTISALADSLGLAPATVQAGLIALESEGFAVQGQFEPGEPGWCERRLLARIHRLSRDQKRARQRPVAPAIYQQFLFDWQGVSGEGGQGAEALLGILERLEGYSAPAEEWEAMLLPARVAAYSPMELDGLCAAGRLAWARVLPRHGQGKANGPARQTPIAFMPRDAVAVWQQLGGFERVSPTLSSSAAAVRAILAERGAIFFSDLQTATGLLRAQLEDALGELVANGLIHADSFAALRSLIRPARQRPQRAPRGRRYRRLQSPLDNVGRWSLLPAVDGQPPDLEHLLWTLLLRYGVICRRILEREALALPWRDLLRVAWRLEARGEIQGGRFIDGLSGEQFALDEAVTALRKKQRESNDSSWLRLSACDPANLCGLVVPGPRIPRQRGLSVLYRGGEAVAWQTAAGVACAPTIRPEQQAEVVARLRQQPVPTSEGRRPAWF